MSYVALPSTLAAKMRVVKPRLHIPAQENALAWGTKNRILLMPGIERWSFGVVLRPLATEEEIREARAFFFSLDGIANTFELPFLPTPQAGANTTVNAAAVQSAKQVSLSSVVDIEAGMPLSIKLPSGHKRLVIVRSKAGNSITFSPGLTEAVSSGAAVQVVNPVSHVRLADPEFSYDDTAGVAGFAFEVREAAGEAGSP